MNWKRVLSILSLFTGTAMTLLWFLVIVGSIPSGSVILKFPFNEQWIEVPLLLTLLTIMYWHVAIQFKCVDK